MPEQVACSAAHAGTWTGLGSAVGEGEGLGLSSGLGLGLGLGLGDGETEGVTPGRGASGPLAVHAAKASRETRRATPFLTAP